MKTTPIPRADAYYTGKEQLVKAMTATASHIFNPPATERRMPKDVTEADLARIRTTYSKIREIADLYGLDLPALTI